MVNMTADEGTLTSLRPHLDAFLGSLPAQSAAPVSWGQTLQPLNEAITVPTQVRTQLALFLYLKLYNPLCMYNGAGPNLQPPMEPSLFLPRSALNLQ